MAYSQETHHEEEDHIHMPSPSWAPIILALGMTVLGFSVIWRESAGGLIGLITGVIVTLLGLGMWIADEIRNASAPAAH
ncbi:MAG: hypothetical protein WCL57_05740 [Chloroflexota bacterium]|jgi:hypothetical protein|nr:hypothetical protein [Chloroflexota bacterium]